MTESVALWLSRRTHFLGEAAEIFVADVSQCPLLTLEILNYSLRKKAANTDGD